MNPMACWVLSAAALLGHFGLHLALYNRLNSLGWPRRRIKRTEKVLFVEMWLTLLAVLVFFPDVVRRMFAGTMVWSDLPWPLAVYGGVCLAAWLVFGLPWLLWRPIFRWEWADAPRRVEVVDVAKTLGRPLPRSLKCRWQSRLPMNQIFDLAVEEVLLPVPGLPKELDGYRIAHLSDIHLTGDVAPDYVRYAVDRASQWMPDMMALSGDIIDKQPCIDWLFDIFSGARASDGCYFVLGNHDTRVVDSWQTREAMDRAGWTDLGSRVLPTEVRGVSIELIGNEHPWFARPVIPPPPRKRPDDAQQTHASERPFRLAISHSPDQVFWAQRHGIELVLAGHTHGGQGRLPLVGPLLSPSFHGSRFASGDFWKPPTTMHVSRGLGGVHLLRVNCRPELSLLVLKSDGP
ncbi:metallophosphoesterase [Crateriforma conspicua]|uniref:metallophosphoesterase n=1 Tax=Crateriforma conspicua TaxID=2527996 RepID=UPI00118828AD|nr:metallophosphoesterase [Crateriforma conspicua]QDV66125.1 phosphodiesterase YaeI [Crateriforma conspicua]